MCNNPGIPDLPCLNQPPTDHHQRTKYNATKHPQPAKSSVFQPYKPTKENVQLPNTKPFQPHQPYKGNAFQSNAFQSNKKNIGTGKSTQSSLKSWFAPKNSDETSSDANTSSLSTKLPLRDRINSCLGQTSKHLDGKTTGNGSSVGNYGSVPKPMASVSPMQALKKTK